MSNSSPEMMRDLAARAVVIARKAGADQADAVAAYAAQIQASCRLGTPELMESAESSRVSLRVWVGQQVSGSYSTDISDKALEAMAEQAVSMARVAPADPYAVLAPDARQYPLRDVAALDLADVNLPNLGVLQATCQAAEAAALEEAGITNSKGAAAGREEFVLALATSNGFSQAYQHTECSFYVSVLAGEGTGMERDHAMTYARHWSDLAAPERIGKEAAHRTLQRLGSRRPKTAAVPVIFEKRVARELLGALASACSGNAVASGASFLRESMGQKLFPEHVQIIDDPTAPRRIGARPWDGEGVACQPLSLVDNGVLRNWLLDSKSALRLGLETNGRAARGAGGTSPTTTSLYLAPGQATLEELIADLPNGLLVTETTGRGVNQVTGDYSQGASGLWIENGKIAYPVSGITVAGRLQDMFANLVAANDLEFNQSVNSPSLLVGTMTVAGA